MDIIDHVTAAPSPLAYLSRGAQPVACPNSSAIFKNLLIYHFINIYFSELP